MPGKRDESIGGAIALPGRGAFEQVPLSLPKDWLPQELKQTRVERPQAFVRCFDRCSAQVWRDASEAAFELSLVKEPQARRAECDNRSCLMHSTGKGGRG